MHSKSSPEVPATREPELTVDKQGPVFAAPWEGQAFAIAISLRDRSLLHWPDFVDYLSAEIAAAGQSDKDGQNYYRHWLRAVERLLLDKNLLTAEELSQSRAKLSAARRHEHRHEAAQPAEQSSNG